MKPYNSLNVEMSHLSIGPTWLVVLSGNKEDVNFVFNGVYNFSGCKSPKLNCENEDATLFSFVSDADMMGRYFFNRGMIKFNDEARAREFQDEQMTLLTDSITEFRRIKRESFYSAYDMGEVSAEKPDLDFRDEVLNHSFELKSSAPKIVDTGDEGEELRFVSVNKTEEQEESLDTAIAA